MDYTVLIVDDSKLARMAATKALDALRPTWKRIEAANADEAIKAIKDGCCPDIILLDFNMPVRNGLELAVEIRALCPGKAVAVVSANHQQEIVSRTHAAGATFLPKPLTQQALAEFLNDAERRLGKAVN